MPATEEGRINESHLYYSRLTVEVLLSEQLILLKYDGNTAQTTSPSSVPTTRPITSVSAINVHPPRIFRNNNSGCTLAIVTGEYNLGPSASSLPRKNTPEEEKYAYASDTKKLFHFQNELVIVWDRAKDRKNNDSKNSPQKKSQSMGWVRNQGHGLPHVKTVIVLEEITIIRQIIRTYRKKTSGRGWSDEGKFDTGIMKRYQRISSFSVAFKFHLIVFPVWFRQNEQLDI